MTAREMRCAPYIALLFVVLFSTLVCGGCALRSDPMLLPNLPVEAREPIEGIRQPSVALLKYGAGVVVVLAPQGAAAIEFLKPFDNDGIGVTYRYRFVRRGGGEEVSGTGMVREKWEEIPAKEEPWPAGRRSAMIRALEVRDLGTVSFVQAGDIRFEWSLHDRNSGWIYFQPSELQMRVARRAEFDVLDLKKAFPAQELRVAASEPLGMEH